MRKLNMKKSSGMQLEFDKGCSGFGKRSSVPAGPNFQSVICKHRHPTRCLNRLMVHEIAAKEKEKESSMKKK